jgi:flagellar biosynthesis/type III secretory pathway protein FliH
MRIIKAPEGFPDADKINARKIDADNEEAVMELTKEIIGRGIETALKSYLQTHEKRLNMLKMNGFEIIGDVNLKAVTTADDKNEKKKKLLRDFIEYVELNSDADIPLSFIDGFFDWKKL